MLLTVGHGTLQGEELAALLKGAEVQAVVDVRSYPGSRRHPQFGAEQLARWMPGAGISYRQARSLGGRRDPDPHSRNVGLRNAAFRGYADHMATPGFRLALAELLDASRLEQTAIMCAESLWWRCHRRLIADAAVLLHGEKVVHLFHDGRLQEHPPMPQARVDLEGRLVYP
jgi:uncharacterized protein (DUF488 family)